MNTQKEAIITIFEDNIKGIAIDPLFCRKESGKIQKINYPNFRYIGEKRIRDSETNREKDVWFIEIYNIPNNMIIEIKNTINDIINSSNITIAEALDKIFEYFRKVKFNSDYEKDLLGDLGEAAFIYKSLEKGYNVIPYFRNKDNDIYDYYNNNTYFEVKSSSLEKNEFIITYEQLSQIKDKKIIITKFKKVPNKTNIIDLYEMINKIHPLNELLLEKKNKWETIRNNLLDSKESDIIANYSLILDNTKISLFNNESLPEINIINMNACKSIDFHVSCTDSETIDINVFYKEVFK